MGLSSYLLTHHLVNHTQNSKTKNSEFINMDKLENNVTELNKSLTFARGVNHKS